jgi:hypothetical protein
MITRRRRTADGGPGNAARQYLLLGFRADDAFESEEEARAAWFAHRDELIAYWTQDPETWEKRHGHESYGYPKPGGPGTRPAAWWTFEAPERRRRIGGTGLGGTDDPDAPAWAQGLWFGCPHVWRQGLECDRAYRAKTDRGIPEEAWNMTIR